MLAEAAHSWSDTGNEVFVDSQPAQRPSRATTAGPWATAERPTCGPFWAALGLFVVGASVSIWHGISELIANEQTEGRDLRPRLRRLGHFLCYWKEPRSSGRSGSCGPKRTVLDRDLLAHALATSDPTVRAVFAEDAAALVGIVIAAAGIGMHELTGVAAWDAVGSILVGVLLGVVAVVLIDRNRRFLTGEPGSPDLQGAALARLEQLPEPWRRYGTCGLEFIGPNSFSSSASGT